MTEFSAIPYIQKLSRTPEMGAERVVSGVLPRLSGRRR